MHGTYTSISAFLHRCIMIWMDLIDLLPFGVVDWMAKHGQLTMWNQHPHPQWNKQEQTLLSSEQHPLLLDKEAPNASHDDLHVSAIALPIEKWSAFGAYLKIESKTEVPKGHWVAFVDAIPGFLTCIMRFAWKVPCMQSMTSVCMETLSSPLPFLK